MTATNWLETWDDTTQTNLPIAVRVNVQMAAADQNAVRPDPIQLLVPLMVQMNTNQLDNSDEGSTNSAAGSHEDSTSNIQHPTSERRNGSKRGSVLVLVLWIALGLVTLTVYFANSSSIELQAADNRASGIVSEQAIDGAARYMTFVLANYATNGTLPSQQYYQSAAVPVGDVPFLADWPRHQQPADQSGPGDFSD